MIRIILCCLFLWMAPLSSAQSAAPMPLLTEAQEQLARDIGRDLRCVVCQAQTIEDSDADFAVDMRRVVREQIADGKTRTEIEQYMLARYGDYVLMKPRMTAGNAVLWFAPFLLLSAFLGWFFVSRSNTPNA